ncbi:MAG TPA: AMP-binding protein, partial [Gammaproteobacteria bacterium]|nr:AMP-binding protein [Gammaproteobacteria bacterium]
MSSVTPQDAARSAAESSEEFWRRRLLAADAPPLPRWTRDPGAGIGEHLEPISAELAERLSRLADELSVSLCSVLLAAHAKVLSALTGEREVATGYALNNGCAPLPCRLTTEPGPWRALWQEAQRAEVEMLSHADYPIERLRHELGLLRSHFETIVHPKADDGGELDDAAVLMVGVVTRDGIALRLQYRLDALDAASAARIAGYHIAALKLIASDPDAEHDGQSLISDDEQRFQFEELRGPRRRLPDERVHELFEQQVQQHPAAIAAVHRDRRWTYSQLNAQANQIARALQAQGVSREGVVAVVTERNLNWMAAVLAVFKAGGAYLPIEPHFPPDRIAKMLSRADCAVVLTENGSRTALDEALDSLAGVEAIDIDSVYRAYYAQDNLDVHVDAEQLAYIYFTSGSTGEPKGVMCEHAGMLNHLFAKIDDLGIREEEVVAQSAPQCFDISLWQLLAAVLVGGRTLLVEQEAVMDAGRFIDRIIASCAAVVQVVPSYLEVLLSGL